MTAASLVFAFTTAQLAMVAGSAVIAFGFRLGSPLRFLPAAQPAAQTTGQAESASSVMTMSRANLLADQLRRFDSVIEGRARAVAASVRMVRPEPAAEPQFAGVGSYRRAGPSRDHLGRRGARR
jgi:hypothetical protein